MLRMLPRKVCAGRSMMLCRRPPSIPRSFGAASAASALSSRSPAAKEPDDETAVPRVDLSFSDRGGVATLTLVNPRRRNALTAGMMAQLDEHVGELAEWSRRPDGGARVLVLTGVGGAFCAGLDLRDAGAGDGTGRADGGDGGLGEGANMTRHMTRVTDRIHSLPVLSVCAVDGFAVGGGAELTTCTDLVVMSREATVQFVHAERGASPGWGGGGRLVRRVGRARALRMLLLGERVRGSEEAAAASYADAVGEEGESALEAARRVVIGPLLELPSSQSVRAIKRAVCAADDDRRSPQSAKAEIDAFLSVWGGESNSEQIRSVRDKLTKK